MINICKISIITACLLALISCSSSNASLEKNEKKDNVELIILEQDLTLTTPNPEDFNPKCDEEKCRLKKDNEYILKGNPSAEKFAPVLVSTADAFVNYVREKKNNWNDLAIEKFEIVNTDNTKNEGKYLVKALMYAGDNHSDKKFVIISKDVYAIAYALKNDFNLEHINQMIYSKYPKFRGYNLSVVLDSVVIENNKLTFKFRLMDITPFGQEPEEQLDNANKKLDL